MAGTEVSQRHTHRAEGNQERIKFGPLLLLHFGLQPPPTHPLPVLLLQHLKRPQGKRVKVILLGGVRLPRPREGKERQMVGLEWKWRPTRKRNNPGNKIWRDFLASLKVTVES